MRSSLLRRAPVVVGVAAAAVLVGGVAAALTHHDDRSTTAVTAGPSDSPSSSAAPSGVAPSTSSSAAPTTSAPTAVPTDTGTATATGAPPGAATTPAGPGATAPPVAVGLPAPGSYAYATSGSEKLSIGGGRTYPATSTIAVAASGCGITETWAPSSQHSEQQLACREGDHVRLRSITTSVSFFGQSQTDTFTCDDRAVFGAAGQAVGSSWTFACTGSDASSSSKATYVGPETVDGQQTRHVHIDTTISGSQSGTQSADYWFRVADSLTVREISSTTAKTQGVTYTENHRLDLQ